LPPRIETGSSPINMELQYRWGVMRFMQDLLPLKSRMDARQLALLESELRSRGKNVLVAYILWYALGIIGGHRFYMKKTGSAVAMLILSIIVFGLIITLIWWIVDAFRLHHWIRDENRELEYHLANEILARTPPAS